MKLKFIKIGLGSYQLIEPFELKTVVTGYSVFHSLYNLSDDGTLRIKRFYAWDGPTGAKNTDNFILSSCVHDVFCELISKGLLPPTLQCLADEQMNILNNTEQEWSDGTKIKHIKMGPIRRAYTYFAVRGFQYFRRKRKSTYRTKTYTIKI